jgi:hypothetical protein
MESALFAVEIKRKIKRKPSPGMEVYIFGDT